MPERFFLFYRIGSILKTVNIVDTVNALNIEIIVIIGPTVNTVNSARKSLLNIVNVAKTLNSKPLHSKFLFKITSPVRVPSGFKFCIVLSRLWQDSIAVWPKWMDGAQSCSPKLKGYEEILFGDWKS